MIHVGSYRLSRKAEREMERLQHELRAILHRRIEELAWFRTSKPSDLAANRVNTGD